MITKNERFNQWRGKKALEEQKYIKSALLVNGYVRSVKNLEAIKTEFSTLKSAQYKEFNKYGTRPFGVLLYCKLAIEEILEQILATAVTERQLLTKLNDMLDHFYHNVHNNISERVDALLAGSKQVLNLNTEQLVDKKQARAFCFDLYMFLCIANLALNNLSMTQRLFANTIISLDRVKQDISNLMRMTENKVEQLDKLLLLEHVAPPEQKQESSKKNIQDYFNGCLLALLTSDRSQEQQLLALEKNIDSVVKDIHHLKIKRMMKEDISLNIQKIHALFNALQENDNLIMGRKYSLELINAHVDSFNVLMDNSNDFNKARLNENIAQLKTPDLYHNLSSKILYSMSWVSSVVTVIYRYSAPQKMQNASANLLITLDSECKQRLKELTQQCLLTLEQKLVETDQELDGLMHDLSRGDMGLRQMLAEESYENLDLLINANKAAQEVVNEYGRIARSLENTALYLNIIRESNKALTTFIQTQDGFWVRLSHFFAQIATIFKSDTAAMLDSAREMKEELGHFELAYKKELTDGIDAIKNNPDINEVIKDRLTHKIQTDMAMEKETYIGSSPNKEEVRYLISNLKKLFNVHTINEMSEQKESFSAESLLPTPY